ncbi:MAG TPA: CcmD family protein [Polyangia bacterium]|jgi:CcmD family protein|nr:CcmD family protein [Polyangia bacterium]
MKQKRRFARRWFLLIGALAWGAPALAVAQEFEKVSGAVREEIPARPLVAAAYGFIWIAILAYVVFVARGLGRVRQDLGDLRAKIDRAVTRVDDRAPRP